MGEELTIHEGEAALGAVAREHSTPVRELLEVASSLGRLCGGAELRWMGWRRKKRKSRAGPTIYTSHAGWVFACSCEPAWPASRRKVQPAHRLQSFSFNVGYNHTLSLLPVCLPIYSFPISYYYRE